MADSLNVELVAADRQVWSGTASIVVARTPEGEIGILAGHEPVLGLLVAGPVTVRTTEGDAIVAAVDRGFLTVSNDHVAILAERAALAEEVDANALRAAGDHSDDPWVQAQLHAADAV